MSNKKALERTLRLFYTKYPIEVTNLILGGFSEVTYLLFKLRIYSAEIITQLLD